MRIHTVREGAERTFEGLDGGKRGDRFVLLLPLVYEAPDRSYRIEDSDRLEIFVDAILAIEILR